jgi:hypothetical protein
MSELSPRCLQVIANTGVQLPTRLCVPRSHLSETKQTDADAPAVQLANKSGRQNTKRFPTAVGVTILSPKALTNVVIARQPVQWPAAI